MKWLLWSPLGVLAACGGAASGGSGDASTDTSTDVRPPELDAGPADSGTEASDGACAEAGTPPSTLSCAGLYSDFATKTLAPSAMAYSPSTPLWSDGATKQRWIELPPDTQIDISNPDEWTFPVGTRVFKEFRVDGKRVETRMFQKTTVGFWVYATYAWNTDDSEATINYGGPVPVGDPDSGIVWNIPTNDDCDECHRGRLDRILGFEEVGLGLPSAQGLTLANLAELGLVTPPPTSVSRTIGNDGTGLDALALGWIHVNCGVTCHNSNPSAAGFGAGMLLRLDPTQLDGSPPNPATWDILNTTLNVPCVSGSLLGMPRIVPGSATHSVLHQLINERGTLQMPPIASLVVDTTDVAVVAAWIDALSVDGGAQNQDAAGPGGELDAGERREAGSVHSETDAGALDATLAEAGSSPTLDSGLDSGEGDASRDATGVEDAPEEGGTDL